MFDFLNHVYYMLSVSCILYSVFFLFYMHFNKINTSYINYTIQTFLSLFQKIEIVFIF